MRKEKVGSLLLMFMLPVAVFAQEDVSVRVLVRHSQEQPPVVGTPWVLTLLIDHSEPDEVTVMAPPFNDIISLEEMIKGTLIMDGIDTFYFEKWTATEFNFTLNNTGTVLFDSFTVITPKGEVQTEPFEITITIPQEVLEKANYRLSWQGVPREMKIGETLLLSLSFVGLSRETPAGSIPLPEYGQFFPTVPQGHILEFIPLSPEEKRTGLALKIRVIAVTAVPFTLDRRIITNGNLTFELPALRIPVSRSSDVTPPPSPSANANVNAIANNRIPPFPSTINPAFVNNRLYTRYRAECENIFNTARNLWERGNIADALVILRRNERDHNAGRLIAVIRREAEQSLGFTGTNDEKKPNPLFFWITHPHPAVVKETTVRRIPDSDGTEITRFREGRPVLVYSSSTGTSGRPVSWLRVVTNDSNGVSGWVPEENIIFY
jgi:hypothetical protein